MKLMGGGGKELVRSFPVNEADCGLLPPSSLPGKWSKPFSLLRFYFHSLEEAMETVCDFFGKVFAVIILQRS